MLSVALGTIEETLKLIQLKERKRSVRRRTVLPCLAEENFGCPQVPQYVLRFIEIAGMVPLLDVCKHHSVNHPCDRALSRGSLLFIDVLG